MEDQERIVVMVPAAVKKRFTKAVRDRGMTITGVIRNLITVWEADTRAASKQKKGKGWLR